MQEDLFQKDRETTLNNRKILLKNRNLLYWYRRLYQTSIGPVHAHSGKKILEIGSGTSPLKLYFPEVITSDILPLDYLDLVFDCQEIDSFPDIEKESLDCITLTNVLHHLKDPLDFLLRASDKLNVNGTLILTEPYLSLLSKPIYRYLHYELTDTKIDKPVLSDIQGPLSSSNQALPYLIFFKRKQWLKRLDPVYRIESIRYYTSMAYFMTGGISHRIPLPPFIYKPIFVVDAFLARLFPRLFASFFTLTLKKK